ncbi:MAG: hypothetical protein NC911_08120 [Candidatus Omnitrophica bacterium]|nr:hypothetical protein [Candidatus Omnitrophota bacterium]
MDSRERVLYVLNHREADRVPCDFWAVPKVAEELRQHLQLPSLAALLDYLNIDLRYVFPRYTGPALRTFSDGSREDIWGIRRDPKYNEVSYAPLSQAESVKEIEKFSWPDPDWYDYSGLVSAVSDYQRWAVVVSAERTNRPSVLHQGIYLCGMEKLMIDLVLRPVLVEAIFEHVSHFYLEVLRRVLTSVSGQVDMVLVGDDLGTQESLLASPEILSRLGLPYLKKYFSLVHRFGVKVMFHCCGAIRPMIPNLIEAGVDVLNPIQVRAAGMNPAELKKEFGRYLCFHGGIDIQQTLSFGTPEDVRREVTERITQLGSQGGYILCSTHNLQLSTPLENILAMYEAARSFVIRR